MKNYSYQFEVRNLLLQFMAAMDNITIKRFNKSKEPQDSVAVRMLYAPKQRVVYDLTDKAQNIQLPVVAVSVGSITRDVSRVFNKIQGSNFDISDIHYTGALAQPVPVDIAVNFSIIGRYLEDIDQIVSNFVPYFDPYIVLSWTIPEMANHEIRSQVSWSGTVSYEYPQELAASSKSTVAANTNFTIKGWLFKSFPEKGDAKIFKADANFFNYEGLYLETRSVSAVPQPHRTSQYTFWKGLSGQATGIKGESFLRIENVYLSGAPFLSASSLHNPFLSSQRLSATYPAFNALQLSASAFTVESDTFVQIQIPTPTATGHFDILIQNEAGVGSLIGGAQPWGEYQLPYVDGLITLV